MPHTFHIIIFQYPFRGFQSHAVEQTRLNPANWYVMSLITTYHLYNPIFIASTICFNQRASMLFLSHFKSKGIYVFFTQPQGHAEFGEKSPPTG